MKSIHNTRSDTKKDSLDSTKSRNQVSEDEIKDEPMDTATKDQLISLLHLGDLSGLKGPLKRASFDYNTLERYIYSDIIAGESVSTNENNESKLEEDHPNC